MNSALELRKYHLMERLMSLSDTGIIKKLESIVYSEDNEEPTTKELLFRASISEQQLKEGLTKTHSQAKERFSKWIK